MNDLSAAELRQADAAADALLAVITDPPRATTLEGLRTRAKSGNEGEGRGAFFELRMLARLPPVKHNGFKPGFYHTATRFFTQNS